MRCRHKNADHLMPGDEFALWHATACDVTIVAVEQFRCLDCGAWLSLGRAATDTPEVKIEKAAAAIVASGLRLHGGVLRSMHWFEGCGWNSFAPLPDDLGHHACDNGEPEDGAKHLAGYLARVIAEDA